MMRLRTLFMWCGLAGLLLAQQVMAQPIARDCPPGQTTWLTGDGPAGSGVLLRWQDQIVGGGVVQANGTWRVPLNVAADQASGAYAVAVIERDSAARLGTWTCHVTNAALPTPGVRVTPPRATASPTVPPTAVVLPTATALPMATTVPTVATPTPTSMPTDTASSTDTTPAAPTDACLQVCIVAAEADALDWPSYLILQNHATSTVDLSGWMLATTRGAALTVPAGTTLAAGDTLLVWAQGAMDGDESGALIWPDLTLAAGDGVILRDASGAEQQQFTVPTSVDVDMDDPDPDPAAQAANARLRMLPAHSEVT